VRIHKWVSNLQRRGRKVDITWVKRHSDVPGNERADKLAGEVAEKLGLYTAISLAHLKLKISERLRKAKDGTPTPHTTGRWIPPPPPKNSCLDRAKNAIARTAAQIRSGHCCSAVYLKMIRKRTDDKCWFCRRFVRMTGSHVLLHCPNEKLVTARAEAREGKNPGGVRVLLANPRWERRFVRFLELSGVGRTMADGTDKDGARAARVDEWVVWEVGEGIAPRGDG